MSSLAVLFILLSLIAFFLLGIYVMLQQKTAMERTENPSPAFVLVCSRGVYALCFGEGYVILTESKQEAKQVCADLQLDMHPYWGQILRSFSDLESLQAAVHPIQESLGASAASFVFLNPPGLRITFQGYISVVRNLNS